MRILIVDGDSSTRARRTSLLRSHGHDVIEASGAQTAIARAFAQDQPPVDLLVTEVILPGGSFGFDLLGALLKRSPKLRVAYTTRYDLPGYEADLDGHPALPATAPEADFLIHVEQARDASPVVESQPMLTPGATLGHYQILQFLYDEADTETYYALQYTVQRPVALVVLKPHVSENPEALTAFRQREKVKASISHPRIAPLYEAGEVSGHHYYTREMPPGQPLDALIAAGTSLTERNLTDTLSRVGEAMMVGIDRGYDYRPLTLRDIFVDSEFQASIVNVFRPTAEVPRDQRADVQDLLLMLLPLTSQGKARGLLSDLASQDLDWATLTRTMHELRDDMSKRSLIERADAVEAGFSSRTKWLTALGLIGALAAVAFLGGVTGQNLTEFTVLHPEMVDIPAGELPAYRISRHEVTIAQYAEFLRAIEAKSTTSFDHPSQPKTKTTHIPPEWQSTYAAAKSGGLLNGESINLNHPVTRVDFWDAWAYAKWRKQRLPTAVEWEYAARGPKHFLYPWGNDSRPTDANFGDDKKDSAGGGLDGFNSTAPVDKPLTDRSPFGVLGMAGNVQEWTGSMVRHPELPDVQVPVVKGGHFGLKSEASVLSRSYYPDTPEEIGLARGFRTAADQNVMQSPL